MHSDDSQLDPALHSSLSGGHTAHGQGKDGVRHSRIFAQGNLGVRNFPSNAALIVFSHSSAWDRDYG